MDMFILRPRLTMLYHALALESEDKFHESFYSVMEDMIVILSLGLERDNS